MPSVAAKQTETQMSRKIQFLAARTCLQLKTELAQLYKQQQDRLIVKMNFINSHLSNVNNSQRRDDYKFVRFHQWYGNQLY